MVPGRTRTAAPARRQHPSRGLLGLDRERFDVIGWDVVKRAKASGSAAGGGASSGAVRPIELVGLPAPHPPRTSSSYRM